MLNNKLCQLLGIRYPLIQGGMVWVSDWHLAVACSAAGILGTLGTGAMDLSQIRQNITEMKRHTDLPVAVNIPLLRPDAKEIGAIVSGLGVKTIITSAGNPAKIIPALKKKDNIVLHVVPSVRGALKAVEAGADGVICEGYEAGGHNSPYETTTIALVPQIADAVQVPVIAAGGIADGRGIAAAIALGADGIQMGTRFIATRECNAHFNYKTKIIEALDTGTCIIGRKLDMLRVLKNDFAERMQLAEKEGADRDTLLEIIGSEFNRNRRGSIEGDLVEGTLQAGQSSGLVKEILTVDELVKQLVREYEKARQSLGPFDI